MSTRIAVPINSNSHIWRALSKAEYNDPLQPIWEMIDNSIAAKASHIAVKIDLDVCLGSIEDNGCGLPSDPAEIGRCFSYGGQSPTDLNEHGCGLKSSLAIQDPSDSSWSVCWKTEDNQMLRFSAPYSREVHEIDVLDVWPGSIDHKTGTLVSFPISRENFSSLYTTKVAKKSNSEEVLKRFRHHMSVMWMYHPRIDNILITINDVPVEPFKREVLHENSSTYLTNADMEPKLSTGADIIIQMFQLSKSVKEIPNTPFKKSQSSSGVRFYKNGRFITHVKDGALFKLIFGSEQHNDFNGTFVFVNVQGTQDQLPKTTPTKNDFPRNNNPLFHEMVDKTKQLVGANVKKLPLESTLQESFMNARKNNLGSVLPDYWIDGRVILEGKYHDEEFKTPQLDICETYTKRTDATFNVYECKRDNMVTPDMIWQLYGNWITALYAHPDKIVTPILMINYTESDFTMPTRVHAYIQMLAEQNVRNSFPLIVMNYQARELWKFRA